VIGIRVNQRPKPETFQNDRITGEESYGKPVQEMTSESKIVVRQDVTFHLQFLILQTGNQFPQTPAPFPLHDSHGNFSQRQPNSAKISGIL
jgi:hypothetical protein